MLSATKWPEIAKRFPAKETKPGFYRTTLARLSFVQLFEPQKFKGGADPNSKARYGLQVLLPPGDTFAILDKALRDVIKAANGGDKVLVAKAPVGDKITIQTASGTKKQIAWPLIDQGSKSFDGYTEGALCFGAYASEGARPPMVLDTKGIALPKERAAEVYSGCYGLVTVNPYWSKGWDRLCIGLTAVQKIIDGEAFGAGPGRPEDHAEDMSDLAADLLADGASPAEAAEELV